MTLIQSELHWQQVEANLAMFEEKIWKVEDKTDLIILPEMFTTGFSMEPQGLAEPVNGRTYKWMKQMAAQTGATVIGSAIIKEGQQYYNRLIVASPEGSVGHYDKKHLFTLAGEDGQFTPGNQRLIIEVNSWRILPLVCYDLRFPVWSRSRSSDERTYEYDLVLYCANWPSPRVNAWDALLKARAIENSAYCLGVNRIGIDGYGKEYPGHSAVYNFQGDTSTFLEGDSSATAILSKDDQEKYRERFPFQKDAMPFTLDS